MNCAEEIIRQRLPSRWRSVQEYIRWFDETESLVPTCKAFHLRQGRLLKPFLREMLPLRHFLANKMGLNATRVFCKPYLGNQPYDARIIDLSQRLMRCNQIEFTEAVNEEDHWRDVYCCEHGSVPITGPIKKSGTKRKGIAITADWGASRSSEILPRAKKLIKKVARNKSKKTYGPRTWFVIWFHVPVPTHFQHEDVRELRRFAVKHIASMVNTEKLFVLFIGSRTEELVEIPIPDAKRPLKPDL